MVNQLLLILSSGVGVKGRVVGSGPILRLWHTCEDTQGLEVSGGLAVFCFGAEHHQSLGQGEMLETLMAFCQRRLLQGKTAKEAQLFSGRFCLPIPISHLN